VKVLCKAVKFIKFVKAWWFDDTLFVYLYFYRLRHTFITYKSQPLSTPLSSLLLLRRGISIGLPGIEPAVQQADAILLSYAAP
jgi:hypothetical protein